MSNEKMVDVNGVRICTEAFGDPAHPAVLLIAGAASSMDWWEDAFCARLASQQRYVVRYDLRDTGRSSTCEAGKPDYTSFDLVTDAVGVLDALGIPRAHMVGISMGGGLAQLLALEFPARVASLTLISTSPAGPSSADLPPMSDRLKAVFDQPAEAPDGSDREAVIRYIIDSTKPFAGTCTASDAELRAVVSRAVDRTVDIAASLSNHWILETGHEPWRSRLGAIRVPTLVIHGTEDPLLPCQHGIALSKEIPGATLLLLEGVGHEMPPAQVWDRVILALVRHTSEQPAEQVSPSPSRPLTTVEAWRRYDDDERRLSAHVSERMLDLAGLRSGSRVLDIASGRGEPALRAAARVAPDGFVVGTDISDDMLDFARARAAAESVTNLTIRVTDGETLAGVPEQAFDAALCRWGLMFFDRPREALKSARRRLRPGGTMVAAVWAAPKDVSWWSMPRGVLARHIRLPPIDGTAPGPFRYASSESFRTDLAGSGFSFDHEEVLATAVMETATPDGLVDWCLAFGLARMLVDQPESVRMAWRRDMLTEAERYRDADGLYRLGGVTRLVVARAS